MPVFNFFVSIPNLCNESDKPIAAFSPNLPALYERRPTNIRPSREVPVVKITARALYSTPNSSIAPVISLSFTVNSVIQHCFIKIFSLLSSKLRI